MRICLCGSTKFKDEFHEANLRLSKAGHVVYTVAAFMHSGDPLTKKEKATLDGVHLQKIQYSEAIYLVKPQYLGDSTVNEIRKAIDWGKRIMIPMKRPILLKYPDGKLFDSNSNHHMYIHTCHGPKCVDWTHPRPCAKCR